MRSIVLCVDESYAALKIRSIFEISQIAIAILRGALLLQARLTCNVSLDRHTTYALCNGQSLGSSELNREDPFKGMSRLDSKLRLAGGVWS